MNNRELKEKKLALPQVKKVLESIGEENLDQFQRRTLDYVNKFSKVKLAASKKLLKKLVKDFDLEKSEAVAVINCMPQSVDELRIFLAGGRKIIEIVKLESIVSLLNDNRITK
jgi:DNA-directed RNA polymerase subunit F